MANPLTAGTWQLVAQAKISGAKIAAQGTASSDTIPDPVAEAVQGLTQLLAFGLDSAECDILCAGAFTIAGGGSLTLDLLTGTDFPNVLGGTAAFAKLQGAFICIPAGGGGDSTGVRIGSTSAPANALVLWFGSNVMTWTIKPSGVPLIGGEPDGVTVDATHKNLILTNNSGSVAVTVVVLLAGSSA